eukprot:TRINITY_DN6693_c0_g1_i1.p1 TRINITY_DN6693_c0_g1~~TRINITY_DN6693_c0_g1_i1.p1  ORF type:complete len:278 (+),score=62.37 TRINITY_DN6693_c0_g1_i1:127-960(+)
MKFPSLRSFPLKLVLFLALTDMGLSLSVFPSAFLPTEVDDNVCLLQAIGVHFFALASFFWTTWIAFTVFAVVVKKKINAESYELFFHTSAFFVPLISCLLVLVVDNFRIPDVWCWIRESDESQFVFFLAPMLTLATLTLWFYASVSLTLRKRRRRVSNWFPAQDASALIPYESQMLSRLTLYLAAFLVCWSPSLIFRFDNYFDPENPKYWLMLAQALMTPLGGLFNFFIYGLNKKFRDELWRLCCLPFLRVPVTPLLGRFHNPTVYAVDGEPDPLEF